MKYLIDTCVLSEFVKRKPAESVLAWKASVSPRDQYISAITIGEIQTGISKLDNADVKRPRLEKWLLEIQDEFADNILPFDESVAIAWGRMYGHSLQNGRTRPLDDTKLAATALVHAMTIVTRNVADMEGLGVPIFNPFEA